MKETEGFPPYLFFTITYYLNCGLSGFRPINCNFQYPIQTPNNSTPTDAQRSASWSTHVHFSHFP